MPHSRDRHVYPLYEKLCQFSPIVGVFGHRQVGKTTFVEAHVSKYVTFDDAEMSKLAEQNPKKFLQTIASSRTAIDECQYVPDLFPALKDWVRVHKKPGQFVLTGSVRFSSRKAIRESLTGRLVSIDLYPLVISELLSGELPEGLLQFLSKTDFAMQNLEKTKKPNSAHQATLEKYLIQGGLPGLCFIRDAKLRVQGISALIDLILDRDLRLITATTLSLETLRSFLRFIARNSWRPYHYSQAKRELGISEVTQKKLLYAFEAIFLIRKIPFLNGPGDTYLLEDQFEEYFFTDGSLPQEIQWAGLLYRNLRAQLGYRPGMIFEVETFKTRGGASVPLVFKHQGRRVGFIILQGDEPTLSNRRSTDAFLRYYPESKLIYVTLAPGPTRVLESRVLLTSLVSLVVS